MQNLTEGQKRYRKYRETYLKYRNTHKRKNYSSDNKYYSDRFLFGGNRIKVLERDNYTCVTCGMTNEEHKKKFGYGITVDHIDGKGVYSKVKNNNLNNLQTLCSHCHGLKDCSRSPNTKPKPIWQMDNKGKKVKLFDSIMDAQRELNINNCEIVNVLRGRQITAHGFIFRYEKSEAHQ